MKEARENNAWYFHSSASNYMYRSKRCSWNTMNALVVISNLLMIENVQLEEEVRFGST